MSNSTSKNIIKRKPLLMYFVFAFAFFWLFLILTLVFLTTVLGLEMSAIPTWVFIASTIIGSWMPSLAAAVVTGVCEGSAAVGKLFGMFFKFRVPGRWYLAAIIPAVLTFAAVGIYRLFGGAASGGINTAVNFWILLFVSSIFTGATGEEPGWRGFALPRLLERHSPFNRSSGVAYLQPGANFSKHRHKYNKWLQFEFPWGGSAFGCLVWSPKL